MKSIVLAIYVLVAACIFCYFVYSWRKESWASIGFLDLLMAILLALIWPILAPFWIWFKIDEHIWKKNYVDIISGRKKWN